jgi:lipoyl(octanoyl) transferase
MALDQALMESVAAGAPPTLRFYRWSPPCLSFGRNQPAAGRYDSAAARALGVDMVRRPTGGMAVLHDREVTYGVALPVAELGGPRATYIAVNRALVAGLRRLGVAAEVQAAPPPGGHPVAGGSGPLTTAPCFQAAAPGEVVAAGRKLVGSAQRRERNTLLQHGSVLLDGDQRVVERLALAPLPPAPPHATLAQLLGTVPPWDAVADALAAGFADALGISLAPGPVSAREARRAGELVTHFRTPAWTWRH